MSTREWWQESAPASGPPPSSARGGSEPVLPHTACASVPVGNAGGAGADSPPSLSIQRYTELGCPDHAGIEAPDAVRAVGASRRDGHLPGGDGAARAREHLPDLGR